jgi:triosephosphate isomerase
MLEIQKFNKIIAANWKMNGSINFINNFLDDLTFENINDQSICIIICPPFTHSYLIANKLKNCYLGGQNCSLFLEGAYTGDVSASMLYDVGCQFCIVGHSERRTIFNETNNEVSIKATNSLNNNIHPIICVGETFQQKKDNRTKEVLSKQIIESINGDSNNDNTIIAYEPIWAIGSGLTPSLDEIEDIHNFIKNEIQGYENYKILYGGSVKSANSKEILNLNSVDGLLIGGASLNVGEFKKILSF